jgi:tetratricopeptide (TPR) repeat protein
MRRLFFTALLVIACAADGSPAAFATGPAQQGTGTEDATYYFLLGRRLESAGRIDEAVAAHKRAIDLDPKSAELRAELAGVYERQNNAVEAARHAEAALERDPRNTEANRILGTAYADFAERNVPLHKGDDPSTYPAKAIAALEKVAGSGDIGVDFVLGRLYLQTGAAAKAITPLKRVVEARPGLADVAVLLSTAQESAGQIDDAVETLEDLLRENPGSYRAQLRIAEIQEHQERWPQAADAYAKAQALNARAPLTSRRAVALLSAGKAAEARDLVQATLNSGRPEAKEPILLYLLAESQRVLRDLDAAHATAQKLITANPDDTRGLHVLSLILQDKGDRQGAERLLRDLIARDPLDANALNSLGYMFAEQGERLDEAVALLQRALKVEPDNPSYLDSLGWAHFQQGRTDLADGPLTNAAEKLQKSSVVQDHLGDLRFKQRRYRDAADAWERALAGDGQSIDRAKIEKKIREARGRM